MDGQKIFFPKGTVQEVYNKGASGMYQNDLYNFALDRDVAKKRSILNQALVGLCVVATVFVVVFANYKTYVVRVDNATGQIELGGELKATNYQPREVEIKHFLSQFVMDTRTIPLDPVQFHNSWTTASHFLTTEASNKLNAFTEKDSPKNKIGRMTSQPQIRSVQLQPGTKSTYQVRWTEEEFSLAGTTTGKKVNYVALFNIIIEPTGSKEEDLMINPLGLKIKDLTISKETESKE